jgi:hypothetical protein
MNLREHIPLIAAMQSDVTRKFMGDLYIFTLWARRPQFKHVTGDGV